MTMPHPTPSPASAPPTPSASSRAQTTVRRILVHGILFALVTVAAVGAAGLIDRVLGAGSVIAVDDTELARSLAFTFIAGPLAGLLWWWQRRRLIADPAERASLVWMLYLTAMSLTSLIGATTALGSAAAAAIDGEWDASPFAFGVVWAAVWVWHLWMRRSPATAPTRLPAVPVVLGALFGVALAAVGAASVIAAFVGEALVDTGAVMVTAQHWVVTVLQSLVWAALGGLVWWWHWFAEDARRAPGAFAGVMLVIVDAAAAAATLFGGGTVVWVGLRMLADTDPLVEVLGPLDTAVAAVLIGGLVWVYHDGIVRGRSDETRDGARLLLAAIALAGAASGFGVVVNAALATIPTALVQDDPRTLLLGGLSALAVGFPVWWVAWRPAAPVDPDRAADTGRRVYLVVVFGVSAVVAIVTLLLIGYRVFEFLLAAGGAAGLVERVRAPLGLLSATAAVFGYHFAVWRHDRAIARALEPEARPAIGRILLVGGADADALAAQLHAQLGIRVSTLRVAADLAALAPDALPALVDELRGISAPRVLVVAAGEGAARVLPLAE